MQPTTNDFVTIIKQGHEVVSRLEAWQGETVNYLEPYDGTLAYDYDDSSRCSFEFKVVDTRATPNQETFMAIVEPVRTLYKPYRGLKHPDGSTEEFIMGSLYPTLLEPIGELNTYPAYRQRAFDGSIRCQDGLATPVAISAGQPLSEAIPQILQNKLPGAKFAIPNTSWQTPVMLIRQDQDPWAECRKLMAANGHDLFFDRNNFVTAAPRVVNPDDTPVWHFDESNADFWNITRSFSTDNLPNVVVVLGNNPGAANITGTAADMDSTSPTYRYGPYGEHVAVRRSEVVTTNEQADEMAKYLLSKMLGPQDEVTLECIPNPALDIGDTIKINFTALGLVQDLRIITHIEMPMTVEQPMKLTTRRSIFTERDTVPPRR